MDAHVARWAVLACALTSLGASYRTNNFVVNAPTPALAEQIGRAAEKYRHDLAIEWLGHEMPNWAQPCPITAQVADNLGAGGATSFVFEHGEVFGWRMTIQGSQVRILDSVLPHEVTHTIFATHFRKPLPRWADEGACTTVEHASEKNKQQNMLIDFLKTKRGIAFSRMFTMKEYPQDVMPLYSQGFSLARYLVAQGGKHKFLEFVGDGMRDENWTRAVSQHYSYPSLAALQDSWLDWVRKGSPAIGGQDAAALVAVKTPGAKRPRPDANPIQRGEPGPGPEADTALASAAGESVYQRAGASKNSFKLAQGGEPNAWRSTKSKPGPTAQPDESELAESASDNAPAAAYQATRPQGVEKARQVILEWSRPHATDEQSGAIQSSRGYPQATATR